MTRGTTIGILGIIGIIINHPQMVNGIKAGKYHPQMVEMALDLAHILQSLVSDIHLSRFSASMSSCILRILVNVTT